MKNYLSLHNTSRLQRVLILWVITFTTAIVGLEIINLPTNGLDNFLTSGLQAIATIVSIVFILSILAIEQSAKNFSATMLELFKKDLFVWFTAVYSLITIGFFATNILFELNFALLCFVLFIWNLGLLGIYLYHVLDLINPTHAINKLVQFMKNAFNKTSKKINKETSRLIKSNSIYRDVDPSMVKHMVIDNDKNLLDEVKKYETYMQYVILSAYKKQEYASTKEALYAYSQIIKHYIQLNPDHFWPDDLFFELIRERVKEYVSRSLQEDDIDFLKQNLEASMLIGDELLAIKNLDSSMTNNDPLVQLVYALSGLCKEYFEQKMSEEKFPKKRWETILQFTRTLGKMGTKSVIRYGKDSQAIIQILEIGAFTIKKMDTFSCITCVKEAFRIFQERAKFLPDIMLDSDMKKLAEYASSAYRLPNAELVGNSFFFEQSGLNPFQYAVNAVRSHKTPFRSFEDELDKDFERVSRIKSLKKHISLIINFTGRINHWNGNNIILKIIIMYLQETKELFREPFTHEEEIEFAISGLSGNKKGNENLAELAIICLENQYDDTAIRCIERISLVAKNMMNNDEHGYDSNRSLRELNLIGCYLQLSPNERILNKVIEEIIKFDEQFEKYFKRPTTDELDLDLPIWAAPSWEFDYKNLNNDGKNQIMHTDNRIRFEMSVVNAKIKHLKSSKKSK